MTNEIQRLNPDLVVSARPLPAVPTRRAVAITGKTSRAVLAELGRRQRRGEIESAGQLQFITEGRLAGQYAVRVVMLPPRQDPRWPRILIGVGSALAGAAALVLAVGWFLTSLSGPALAAACLTPVALLMVWLKLRYSRPAARIVIHQHVNVGR